MRTRRVLAVLLLGLCPASGALAGPAPSVEEFSTRGQVELINGWFSRDDAQWASGVPTLALPASLTPPNCPPSIVIYVHGFENSAADATANFTQAAAALKAAGYTGTVYGYSWDSNPGAFSFDVARKSADLNGKVLAQLLLDIKRSCPDTKINVLTHSLGARVALRALRCGGCAHSVQMLAPAVDNEVLEAGEEFGAPAIGRRAGTLKVWFNDEDDVLGVTYPLEESDSALGSAGSEHGAGCLPANVFQCDAQPKMEASALAGGKTPNPAPKPGIHDAEDDHSGYIWCDKLMACVKKGLK